MSLDIIIPTLNAAATLARTLSSASAARGAWPCRIVVVDGGSGDDTAAIAHRLGALVVTAPPGRGSQLAAGAAAGTSDWLMFLHADTVLSPHWIDAVRRHIDTPANAGRAGYFRLRFDSGSPRARTVERLAAWRSRALGLPYGDQGLLIGRRLHDHIGGYRPLPLMEDVDLARRLGRSRLAELDAEAVTSAARYERDGWTLRPLRNLCCLALFTLGVPPRLIARVYGPPFAIKKKKIKWRTPP